MPDPITAPGAPDLPPPVAAPAGFLAPELKALDSITDVGNKLIYALTVLMPAATGSIEKRMGDYAKTIQSLSSLMNKTADAQDGFNKMKGLPLINRAAFPSPAGVTMPTLAANIQWGTPQGAVAFVKWYSSGEGKAVIDTYNSQLRDASKQLGIASPPQLSLLPPLVPEVAALVNSPGFAQLEQMMNDPQLSFLIRNGNPAAAAAYDRAVSDCREIARDYMNQAVPNTQQQVNSWLATRPNQPMGLDMIKGIVDIKDQVTQLNQEGKLDDKAMKQYQDYCDKFLNQKDSSGKTMLQYYQEGNGLAISDYFATAWTNAGNDPVNSNIKDFMSAFSGLTSLSSGTATQVQAKLQSDMTLIQMTQQTLSKLMSGFSDMLKSHSRHFGRQ